MPASGRPAHQGPKRSAPLPALLPQQPYPAVGVAALPPIPPSYICVLLAMLAGVVSLQLLGATLLEAVAVVETLVATIGVLVWRRGR